DLGWPTPLRDREGQKRAGRWSPQGPRGVRPAAGGATAAEQGGRRGKAGARPPAGRTGADDLRPSPWADREGPVPAPRRGGPGRIPDTRASRTAQLSVADAGRSQVARASDPAEGGDSQGFLEAGPADVAVRHVAADALGGGAVLAARFGARVYPR